MLGLVGLPDMPPVVPMEAVPLACLLLGVVLGYALHQRRRGYPWARAYRVADEDLVVRITRAARLAVGEAALGAANPSTPRDLAELTAFYTRWLNLPRAEREELRNALLGDGIDMIRLGDALRRFRDAS